MNFSDFGIFSFPSAEHVTNLIANHPFAIHLHDESKHRIESLVSRLADTTFTSKQMEELFQTVFQEKKMVVRSEDNKTSSWAQRKMAALLLEDIGRSEKRDPSSTIAGAEEERKNSSGQSAKKEHWKSLVSLAQELSFPVNSFQKESDFLSFVRKEAEKSDAEEKKSLLLISQLFSSACKKDSDAAIYLMQVLGDRLKVFSLSFFEEAYKEKNFSVIEHITKSSDLFTHLSDEQIEQLWHDAVVNFQDRLSD